MALSLICQILKLEFLRDRSFALCFYVIYVNDIPNALNCIPRLYADDTCLFIHEHKTNILEKEISANIHNLQVWLVAKELILIQKRLPV